MAEIASPREAVDTNWDALTNAFDGEQLSEVKKPEPIATENKGEEAPEEVKIDQPPAPETKTPEQEAEALKLEAKELGLPDTATKEEIEAKKVEKPAEDAPIIEFKADDIEGNEKEPPEGSWLAVAKEAGLKIENDSFEDFKQALIQPYIKQAEEAKTLSVETLFTGLKPETVAAFKLMEMGIPEERLFEPTKEIDNYLAMDSAALIRADLELQKFSPEFIDKELESLTAKNLLEHEAEKIRVALNQNKAGILQERQTYIDQYESKKEQAILAQKEEENNNFKQAMSKVSTFMGSPLPDDLKEAVIRKFNNGAYDKDLTSAEAKAEYVLYKELNQKLLKTIKGAAFSEGRETIRKNLLAVPPASNNNAGQKQIVNQENEDNWAAMDKMAKALGH